MRLDSKSCLFISSPKLFLYVFLRNVHCLGRGTSQGTFTRCSELFSPALHAAHGSKLCHEACPCQFCVGRGEESLFSQDEREGFCAFPPTTPPPEDMLLKATDWEGKKWADCSSCSNETGGFPKLVLPQMWWSNWQSQIHGNISVCLLLRTKLQRRQKLQHERREQAENARSLSKDSEGLEISA